MREKKEQIIQEATIYEQIHKSSSSLPIDHYKPQYKCRVCSGQNQPHQTVNSYCSCSIDKGGAHENCLKQFLQIRINKKVQKLLDYSNELQCQLCNQTFCVKIQTSYKCRESQNLKKQIKRNNFIIGILFVGFVLSLIALISCSNQLDQQLKKQSTDKNRKIDQTLIAFIILSTALLLFFSWKIIFKFFIVAKIKINF